ncbi:glycosyltransferase family 4 protein [Vibrio splendidus]
MNIGFLLGDATGKGGIEKVVLTLSSALAKHHNSRVISLYKGGEQNAFSNLNTPVDYLSINNERSMYNRKYSGLLSYIFDVYYIAKKSVSLIRYSREKKLDVLVTCDIKMACLAYLASLFCDFKIIAVEHFEYDVANAILKKIRKFLYNRFEKVITLTNEDFEKYYWLNDKKLDVIPNIVKVNVLQDDMAKENEIVAVGRLTHQKGFDLLIEAWSQIEGKNEGWKLSIYGDGEEKDNLQKLIKSYLLENVVLNPFTDNIDAVYSKSKVFVLSSRYEGLGMVLIEALAHKLPCVSFDCPAGPKTIIKHDYNGLLVSTGDVSSLAESINLIINNSELRHKYSNNALASIHDFSEDVVVEKWNSVLDGN